MLITLNPGETRQITWAASQAHTPPVEQYLVANLDLTNSIYIGPADAGRQVPDLSTDISRSQVVALQGIHVSARQDWYAYNPNVAQLEDIFIDEFTDQFSQSSGAATVQIDVIPDSAYWAPSPAQGAQQIAALGLATEATATVISTNTANTVTSTTMTADNTGTALTAGVPPGVPNIATSIQSFKSPGTYTIHTMSADGRLWMASCSGTYEGNAGYGGGLVNTNVSIVTASGLTLSLIELAITVANQITNDTSVVPWNGIPLNSGDVIQLVVGTAPAGTVIRGSGFAAWSIP